MHAAADKTSAHAVAIRAGHGAVERGTHQTTWEIGNLHMWIEKERERERERERVRRKRKKRRRKKRRRKRRRKKKRENCKTKKVRKKAQTET